MDMEVLLMSMWATKTVRVAVGGAVPLPVPGPGEPESPSEARTCLGHTERCVAQPGTNSVFL